MQGGMELITKHTTRLLSAALLLTVAITPASAATSGFIDVFVDESADSCGDSVLVIESSWSFTRNDANG